RQQWSSIAMTKERDLEFGLSAGTCAIQVAVFLIDVVFRLGIARKKTIVPSHLPQPGRKRRLEIFRRQEQKIIDDRHFLLFGFGNCWRVILIESERDLQCPSSPIWIYQLFLQHQLVRRMPCKWFNSRLRVRFGTSGILRKLRCRKFRQRNLVQRVTVSKKNPGRVTVSLLGKVGDAL